MKSARVITKSNKNATLYATGVDISVPGHKRKTSAKNIFSKTSDKISARTQFMRIKEALKEVELIEAGSIKPKTLDDLLDEL